MARVNHIVLKNGSIFFAAWTGSPNQLESVDEIRLSAQAISEAVETQKDAMAHQNLPDGRIS
jgi:hypothetical protein